MKIHKIEQRTDEWYAVRAGKLTASEAGTIATNGVGLKTLCYKTVAEKYSENRDFYQSEDMERGVELEEQARALYGFLNGVDVEQVGFIEADEYSGCSPDGLVGAEGGVEIKCPNDTNFLRLLVEGKKAIDKKYLWQCQMSILVSGRSWWDLVFYSENFEKNLLVFRQFPDMEMQEKLRIGIEKGKNLIKEIEGKLNNK